ncbi:MAG: peptidase dimerization domain-containing protein, partial [bacterium]|nr:peptidase dimerization domain-containing protein [bacterium]
MITKEGSFASASIGIKINLWGRSSHAAQPGEGVSPSPAVSTLISFFEESSNPSVGTMTTLTHVSMGNAAYGTSPGEACLMGTLRAPSTEAQSKLVDTVSERVAEIASANNLMYQIAFDEEFPATENSVEANAIVTKTSSKLGYETISVSDTFPWSEDFGHFTSKFSGVLFGL